MLFIDSAAFDAILNWMANGLLDFSGWQVFFVLRFFSVQLGASEQDCFDAMHMGAVGVFSLLAFGVVFAVNRGPLFGHLTRGHPQPEAKKVRHDGVQVQGSVSLMTVQKDGHAGNGDVREAQDDKENLPAREVQKAIGHPVEDGIKCSRVNEQHAVAFYVGMPLKAIPVF
jgi:hypothetical protein